MGRGGTGPGGLYLGGWMAGWAGWEGAGEEQGRRGGGEGRSSEQRQRQVRQRLCIGGPCRRVCSLPKTTAERAWRALGGGKRATEVWGPEMLIERCTQSIDTV